MDFTLTPKQVTLQTEVLEFAQTLNAGFAEREKSGEFSREAWKACADFGIQGLAIPAAVGGNERADILDAMIAMESMGIGCRDLGLLFALNAQMWTVQLPILQFGSSEQQERFLPAMCSGDWIGAHAITEANSGSDVFALETTAQRCSDGYRLNGTKRMVTLAPLADVHLVFATVDPQRGKWGVTAFLVEKDRPGLDTTPARDKMGLRTVPLGEVHLRDCVVPEGNRLGAEGSGFALSQHSLEYERCCILASQVGAMQHQLEQAIAFATQRIQFGQTISHYQSVTNRLADMRVRIETSRLLLYKVAWLKQQGRSAPLEAAMLKLLLSEAYVDSSLDAIRVHGGRGYLTDEGIEKDLRDAVGGVLYAGTSDIQRNIIARLMGLHP